MRRLALIALFTMLLVAVFPVAALAQTTTTEPYSGGAVTETTVAPQITVAANGLVVTFTAAGVSGACTWDFGDGSSATGNPVTHTYDAEGDYTIGATCGAQVLSRTVHFAADLNFTGMEVLPWAAAAAALLVFGFVLVRSSRGRSRRTD